ncbi:MAG TPA: TM2 domain-containing protein [Bacteroidia bacterium]|nr:TM2 domain-containing protein [Bacteroidia bacterium]
MDIQQMIMMLPGIQPDELAVIQGLTKDMSETQQQQFYTIYQGKRKEQQFLMLMTLIGFLGVAGIQRFIVGEIGMGILYLLTCGFCAIGTIIDLINIKRMTSEFNQKQAIESAKIVSMMSK